jgi:hypothetical protein
MEQHVVQLLYCCTLNCNIRDCLCYPWIMRLVLYTLVTADTVVRCPCIHTIGARRPSDIAVRVID